jgi:ribosome-interacting GTPase 1
MMARPTILLHRIWDMMGLVRIYTKKTGNKPDFGDPVVLSEDRGGRRLKHFCKLYSSEYDRGV